MRRTSKGKAKAGSVLSDAHTPLISEGTLVNVPIIEEIDFPVDWFRFSATSTLNDSTVSTEGSGGWPLTATKEP